jgi:FlaA1/EpsC-like NDP-sugar epimerase
MNGVKIVGGKETILENVEKFDIKEIYIAIPSATKQERKDLIEICKDTKCTLKILPGIYQMMNGEASLSHLKDVEIEDLLGTLLWLADDRASGFVTGTVIPVDGGFSAYSGV